MSGSAAKVENHWKKQFPNGFPDGQSVGSGTMKSLAKKGLLATGPGITAAQYATASPSILALTVGGAAASATGIGLGPGGDGRGGDADAVDPVGRVRAQDAEALRRAGEDRRHAPVLRLPPGAAGQGARGRGSPWQGGRPGAELHPGAEGREGAAQGHRRGAGRGPAGDGLRRRALGLQEVPRHPGAGAQRDGRPAGRAPDHAQLRPRPGHRRGAVLVRADALDAVPGLRRRPALPGREDERRDDRAVVDAGGGRAGAREVLPPPRLLTELAGDAAPALAGVRPGAEEAQLAQRAAALHGEQLETLLHPGVLQRLAQLRLHLLGPGRVQRLTGEAGVQFGQGGRRVALVEQQLGVLHDEAGGEVAHRHAVLRGRARGDAAVAPAQADEGAAGDGEGVVVAVQPALGAAGAVGHDEAAGDRHRAVAVDGVVARGAGVDAAAVDDDGLAGVDGVVGAVDDEGAAVDRHAGLALDAFGRQRALDRRAGGGDRERAAVDGDARVGVVGGRRGVAVLGALPGRGDGLVVAGDRQRAGVDGDEADGGRRVLLAFDLDALAGWRRHGEAAAVHDEGVVGAHAVLLHRVDGDDAADEAHMRVAGQRVLGRRGDAQAAAARDDDGPFGEEGGLEVHRAAVGQRAGGVGAGVAEGIAAGQHDEGALLGLQVQRRPVGAGQRDVFEREPVVLFAVDGDCLRAAAAQRQLQPRSGGQRGRDGQPQRVRLQHDDGDAAQADLGAARHGRADAQARGAAADCARAQHDGQAVEGQGAGRVIGCPHCFAFDPLVEAWVHKLPADVSFRRVPVGQQAMLKLHARMYYALEAMGALTPAVHTGIFNAFHRQGVDANYEAAVVALVGKLGVDTARFKQAFSSFGVQGKLAQGQKLAELCGADSVPAVVVGGRFRTGPGMAGGEGQNEAAQGQQALAVTDVLIRLSRGKG
ncbi:DsbA-like protein [Ostertagia ostertagi]